MGAEGYPADYRGQPAALAAAGVHLAMLDPVDAGADEEQQQQEQGWQKLGAEDRGLVAAAAAAAVASDPSVRSALLEGLCLFVSGALQAHQPGQPAPAASDAELAEVATLLRHTLQQRAEAAATAAAALLLQRVAQPVVEAPDGDGMLAAAAKSSSGVQLHAGIMVPVAALTWGDEAAQAAAGQLPTVLPAELMQYPSCRQLQLQLLALEDSQLSWHQLHLFAMAGGLLQWQLPSEGAPAQVLSPSASDQLRQVAAALASSGGSSASVAGIYRLLVWLAVEAAAPAGNSDGVGAEWRQLLRRSLAHEAWLRWHQSLWGGAAAGLPAAHAAAMPLSAQQHWAAAAAGPVRLHIAAGSVLASAVIAGPPALIAERSARLLQLKLAARQLRDWAAASSGAETPTAAAAAVAMQWQAASAVAAATLAAHLPSVADTEQRRQLERAIGWLAAGPQVSEGGTQLLQVVSDALRGSSHPVLQELLHPLLLPALQGLLEGSAAASSAIAQGEERWQRCSFGAIAATFLEFKQPLCFLISMLCALPCLDGAPTHPRCRERACPGARLGPAGRPAPAPAAAPRGCRPCRQARPGAGARA